MNDAYFCKHLSCRREFNRALWEQPNRRRAALTLRARFERGEAVLTIGPGHFTIDAEPVPLADVTTAWESPAASRVVFTV